MSLVKKHAMTEKKLAANWQNQQLCNGPVKDERRERIRAAVLRFGFNARAMRRMQDSNLREVRRLSNLLLKIDHYERQMES
jgi:hypothetical protein